MNTFIKIIDVAVKTSDMIEGSEKDIISKSEIMFTLLGFALAWVMLIKSAHFMNQKPEARLLRLVSFQGQVYYVTGKVKNAYFKAMLIDGKKEIIIPVLRIHKVAGYEKNDTKEVV
jgi:hypothetical protein